MRRVLIGALILAVLAFVAWRVTHRTRAPRVAAPAPADTANAGVKAVKLYFGATDGDGLVTETREVMDASDVHTRIATLVEQLDRGPLHGGVAVLPAGTAVLHAYLDDRGLLTLDLSKAFVQGFHGGSTTEWLAVASLVRTLADNVPEVKRIELACGGTSIATLGGHLALDRPLEVSEWP